MDEDNTRAKNVYSGDYGRVLGGKQELLDWFSLPQELEKLIYLSQYVHLEQEEKCNSSLFIFMMQTTFGLLVGENDLLFKCGFHCPFILALCKDTVV